MRQPRILVLASLSSRSEIVRSKWVCNVVGVSLMSGLLKEGRLCHLMPDSWVVSVSSSGKRLLVAANAEPSHNIIIPVSAVNRVVPRMLEN